MDQMSTHHLACMEFLFKIFQQKIWKIIIRVNSGISRLILNFPKLSLNMIFMTFSGTDIFELDLKFSIIIFKVNFGKFEIHREIPEFNLIIITKIVVLK